MTQRKTNFITRYNYGKEVVSLDEYTVSLGTNCTLSCEYCYLKFAKTPPVPVLYHNLESFQSELDWLFSCSKDKIFYFNFGETTDVFISNQHFDQFCKSIDLISSTAVKYDKFCFVELRTKTDNIFKFGKTFHYKNVSIVYAPSLSPQDVVATFEKGTANVNARVESLHYSQTLGFLVGLRFEPIILYPVEGIYYEHMVNSVKNVVENYKQLIQKVFQTINAGMIHSIILSCLRLTKKQFKLLLKKRSKLCTPEMFLCQDKKYRYSRPVRVTIYNELIKYIRENYPAAGDKILLSYEFEYIWKSCGLEIKTLPQIGYHYAT